MPASDSWEGSSCDGCHHVTFPLTMCWTELQFLARDNQFSSIQLNIHVRLFVTPWTAAHQASLSITNFQSLLKFVSIELVMPSNHLILCCPLLLPSVSASIRVFSNEFFASGGQIIGASAFISVLPMNIQDWFPLGLTGLISLQSKGFSRESLY